MQGLGRRRQATPLGKMLAEQTGAGVDRAGRIKVQPDLTLPGHPEVFVVGDMMALTSCPAWPRSPSRAAATRPRQIKGRLAGQPAGEPFQYFDKGSMATISRFSRRRRDRQDPLQRLLRLDAVARRPPRLHHRLQEPDHHAAALGGQLHRPRPVRAGVTQQQVFARMALQHLGDDFQPSLERPTKPDTTTLTGREHL